MSCTTVARALSDGDGRVTRRRDVRAHLRHCEACRAFRKEIKNRQRDLAALSPLPAVAAAGMLHGLLGGSQGAAGSGLAATLGGGAAKTIGASATAKGVATAAVVAPIGVTTADQTGFVHLGLPGEQKAKPAKAALGTSPATSGQETNGPDGPAVSPGREQGRAGQGRAGAAVGTGSKGATQQQVQATPAPGASGAEHRATPAEGNGNVQAPGHENADVKEQGPPAEHAQGQGQEKETPAAGGQETAAEHKSPAQESGGGNGEPPVHPAHPPKPPHPSTPAPTQTAPPEEAPANPPAAAPELQPPGQVENPGKGPPETPPGWSKAGEKGPG